jgi:hypothetical protein
LRPSSRRILSASTNDFLSVFMAYPPLAVGK